MPCDYHGCFECFMRDEVGDSEWIEGTDGAFRSWPKDPFERRCMFLNMASNARRYHNPRGEVRRWNDGR